jgi:hypothetical protein
MVVLFILIRINLLYRKRNITIPTISILSRSAKTFANSINTLHFLEAESGPSSLHLSAASIEQAQFNFNQITYNCILFISLHRLIRGGYVLESSLLPLGLVQIFNC